MTSLPDPMNQGYPLPQSVTSPDPPITPVPVLNLSVECPCGQTHTFPLSKHQKTTSSEDLQNQCEAYRHHIVNTGIESREGGYRKVLVVIEKNRV